LTLHLEPAANGAYGAGDASAEELRQLRFTEAARAAIRGAVKEALRLRHNYIRTEHLLLGILFAQGDAGQLLIGLGLTTGLTDRRSPRSSRESRPSGAQPDEERVISREEPMRALVSWEDAQGTRHRWEIAYDPDDAEARHFLEGIELHVRFRLETFDAGSDGPESP
jgi:Clp amino terminal domain, pathogenicity island component